MKWVLLGILAGIPLLLGLAQLLHVLARNRIKARFEQFKEKVIQFRQRVEAIQERHKFLTYTGKDYKEPMVGTTLALYRQLEVDHQQLSEDWLRRMDLWEKVENLIRSEHPLGAGRFNEAGRLLDTLGSFDAVDEACATCVQQLDRLEKGHEEGRKQLARAEERTNPLRQQIESIRGLGFPTDPYESALAQCPPLIEQARQALSADPLGAGDTLTAVHAKMDDLGAWIDDVVRLHARTQKIRDELEAVRRRVASRRGEGLLLTEPDGNPDPLLCQAGTAQEESLHCLHRAENKPAEKHLDRAFSLVEQAADVIERQAAARTRCARDVPARRADATRLRQAVDEAHDHRGELQRNFDPASWTTVAENTARAVELQNQCESLLDEAAEASADSVQHYFRAADLLDQVQAQQEEAQGLARAIGQQLRELTDLRRECSRKRQEIAGLGGRVEAYLADHDRAVRSPARSRFDAGESNWRQAQEHMDVSRPHWPAAHDQLEHARQEYTAALKEAEEDVRNHDKLTAELDEAEREADRVGLFLRQYDEDRTQANQGYRAANEALQRIREDSMSRAADWGQLLKRVQDAVTDLSKAEQQAREDIRLADQADTAIAEASRELERARDFCEMGITADVSRATDLLEQARQHLGGKAYEKAVEQARTAQQAARQAHDEAVNRVKQEQQRASQPSEPSGG